MSISSTYYELNNSRPTGIKIVNVFILGKLMAKQKVALECLSYHATASSDDTSKLYQDPIPSAEIFNLYRYVQKSNNICQFLRLEIKLE